MNIEIANRLCNLRKEHNMSQEQLAEKIGVSRQAVSKWERGEASPDTDNLIALAQIYNVSIDEILTGKHSNTVKEEQSDSGGNNTSYNENIENNTEQENFKKAKFSFKNGIHVDDGDDHVHVDWNGVHVDDSDGTHVHVGWNGIHVSENGEDKVYTDENGHIFYKDKEENNQSVLTIILKNICIPIVAVIAFLIWGFCFNGWAFAWLVFLALPVYYSLIEAIEKRKPSKFCFPVLIVIVYMVLGLCCNLWHPGWVLFLTIPVFYGICSAFAEIKKVSKNKENIDF
ncbi:MAG: helix-turn-helix domain-containing protein [Acutalibacteraceae bacterium]|nr:helix-turn-helix domain-containing protein [Acutalibacteraceae bacterium]